MSNIIVPGTPEWHTARSNGVSGTDIGAIIGVSNFKTRNEVFRAKTIGGQKFQSNENMRWGVLMEPVIAGEWALINNLDIEPGMFVAKDWMLGSPDFLVKGHKWGMEVKTAGFSQLAAYKAGKCPLNYEYQCRWYMLVMDYERWFLAALVGGQKMFQFKFERDERIDAMLLEAGKTFWDEVLEWRKNHPKGQ